MVGTLRFAHPTHFAADQKMGFAVLNPPCELINGRSSPESGPTDTTAMSVLCPIGDIGLERKRPPTEAGLANSRRGFFTF
jgi:hypothetical protein